MLKNVGSAVAAGVLAVGLAGCTGSASDDLPRTTSTVLIAALHDVQDGLDSAKGDRGHYPSALISATEPRAGWLASIGVQLPKKVRLDSYATTGRGPGERYAVCLVHSDNYWASVEIDAKGTRYTESSGKHCPESMTRLVAKPMG